VETGDLTLTGDVVVPVPPPVESAAISSGSGLRTGLLWGAVAAVLLSMIVAATFLLRRRPDEPAIARGQAAVPDGVARGHATIPDVPQTED
jgi:hypothetical protein